MSEGSGQFTDQTIYRSTAKSAGGSDVVTLNLVNVPIPQAAKVVLGDILKLNYTVSDKISGNLTVQTAAPVPRDAVADIFESALKAAGVSAVRGNGFFRLEPGATAVKGGMSLTRDGQRAGLGTQVRVVSPQHISATDAKRLIEPISVQGAVLRADDSRGLLVLAGTARELAEMIDHISVFDVDWMKGMSFAMFPVRTSDPASIARELETVFGLDKDGPLRGVVRFVPNKRLGSILVISSRAHHIDTARGWIQKLDRLAEDNEEQLFVYRIQNRQATELASLLSHVLGKTSVADRDPGSGVAPRFDTAATVSTTSGTSSVSPAPAVPPPATSSAFGAGTAMSSFAASPSNSSWGNGADVSETANQALKSGQKVVADEANNTLLILATHKEYRRIQKLLQRMDVLPTQVMLEAMIAEVTLNDELRFGLQWFLEKKQHEFTLSDAISGAVASSFPGFSYFFSAANVKAALDAVSSITKVNVVSAPSLMVLDNKKAVLQVGDQVPIVTQTGQIPSTIGAPILNTISMKDTGVILSVTPRVNDAGRVVLDIEQEVSNVARTTSSGIDSPTIQQRRVRTTVVVADGEVVALGGLIQERENVSKTQVPILGNIPVLGTAFRSKTDSIDRTELLIFIRPLVVRDSTEARAVTEEYRKRIKIEPVASQRGRDEFDRDLARIAR